MSGDSFFKYHFGWVAGDENLLWFWLKNTGLFWPAFIGGVVAIFIFKKGIPFVKEAHGFSGNAKLSFSLFKSQLTPIYFSLTFLLLFLLSNFILFAPGEWDNIKILIYWYIGSLPVVSTGLAILYQSKRFRVFNRSLFFIVIFLLVFSGGIDLFRYTIAPVYGWLEFTGEEVTLAKQISVETEPDAVFLNAPTFNHPVVYCR